MEHECQECGGSGSVLRLADNRYIGIEGYEIGICQACGGLPASEQMEHEEDRTVSAQQEAAGAAIEPQSRAAFEAWCEKEYGPRWRLVMRSLDPAVAAWEAWQSASPTPIAPGVTADTMGDAKEREDFEREMAANQYRDFKFYESQNLYQNLFTQAAWLGWQLGRAAAKSRGEK